MVKLSALYARPADPAAFDRHYDEVHLPLVRQIPGLARIEVARVTGAPRGESPFYLITEMYWESAEALQASMALPEMRAVGRDAREFAGDLLTMHIAEVIE
jgi:uncharacterized protein (TIGR02118 family)